MPVEHGVVSAVTTLAKDSGVVGGGVGEVRLVAEWGILMAVAEDQVEAEEEDQDHPLLIHWRVIGAGCMAIWPVTVLNPVASQREVARAALPVELSSNLGIKAHSVVEEEVGKFGSLTSMSCTMRRVIHPQLMSQDNCMCHWTLSKLLLSLLRWKM